MKSLNDLKKLFAEKSNNDNKKQMAITIRSSINYSFECITKEQSKEITGFMTKCRNFIVHHKHVSYPIDKDCNIDNFIDTTIKALESINNKSEELPEIIKYNSVGDVNLLVIALVILFEIPNGNLFFNEYCDAYRSLIKDKDETIKVDNFKKLSIKLYKSRQKSEDFSYEQIVPSKLININDKNLPSGVTDDWSRSFMNATWKVLQERENSKPFFENVSFKEICPKLDAIKFKKNNDKDSTYIVSRALLQHLLLKYYNNGDDNFTADNILGDAKEYKERVHKHSEGNDIFLAFQALLSKYKSWQYKQNLVSSEKLNIDNNKHRAIKSFIRWINHLDNTKETIKKHSKGSLSDEDFNKQRDNKINNYKKEFNKYQGLLSKLKFDDKDSFCMFLKKQDNFDFTKKVDKLKLACNFIKKTNYSFKELFQAYCSFQLNILESLAPKIKVFIDRQEKEINLSLKDFFKENSSETKDNDKKNKSFKDVLEKLEDTVPVKTPFRIPVS